MPTLPDVIVLCSYTVYWSTGRMMQYGARPACDVTLACALRTGAHTNRHRCIPIDRCTARTSSVTAAADRAPMISSCAPQQPHLVTRVSNVVSSAQST